MKIKCIQMNMELASPDANFEKAKKLIKSAVSDGADVILLPETWNTGFFPTENLKSYCDDNGQRTKTEIGSLAKQYSVNIVAGSVANVKDGKVYNTSYVFDRNGECVASYDKTHLFTMMDEDRYFEKGTQFCRFTLDGVRCGIIICYDVRFPELTRTMAVVGLDVLFMVSQWPDRRIPHLKVLTAARAIENQIFVACCNSCGVAGETVYGGHSAIINPLGEVLVEAGESEEIVSADCDISEVSNIRESMKVFRDRRTDLYRIN